jgi:hypothetical protein
MVSTLIVSPSGHIFAGTTGSGVFRSIQTITSVQENNKTQFSFELRQNYPNPFNSSTKIVYSIHKSEYIVLKVYDGLGRELQTLMNKFQNPGEYTIIFDAQGLSSGIYFYKLLVGNIFVQTKKMILIL